MQLSKKEADQIIRLSLAAAAAIDAGIELPRKDGESKKQAKKHLLKAFNEIGTAAMATLNEVPQHSPEPASKPEWKEAGIVRHAQVEVSKENDPAFKGLRVKFISIHVGSTYIHNETKQQYVLLDVALREADKFPMAVFENIESQQTWVRPLNEFAEKFTVCHSLA